MNYEPLILLKLQEFTKEHPEMTVMEVIYSSFRQIKELDGEFKRADLLKITDQELYRAISKAIKSEQEE